MTTSSLPLTTGSHSFPKPLTIALLLASSIVITSCSSSRLDPRTSPADMPDAPESNSTSSGASDPAAANAAVMARIRQLVPTVSRLRELPALGEIAGTTIDRPAMLRLLTDQMHDQVPAEAVRGEGDFLSSFGFLPDQFDYEHAFMDMLESELAGFYDPGRKTLFVMSDMVGAEAEVTLVHELVHALQDQHYDIGSRLAYRPDSSDAVSASQALAEGDATSAMLDYSFRGAGQQAFQISDSELRFSLTSSMVMSPTMSSAPRIMRDSLVAPYVDGILFVHALRRMGGWRMVDEAWRNPPTTTSQLLHVEKWRAHQPAVTVSVPVEPPGGSWVTVHTDVYGEQGLRIALEEWMPRSPAARAAAGWGGDRAVVWRNHDDGVTVAAWRIRFERAGSDGGAEAKEAFDLVSSFWDPAVRHGGTVCRKAGTAGIIAITRLGRDVLLTAAPGSLDDKSPTGGCGRLGSWSSAVFAAP